MVKKRILVILFLMGSLFLTGCAGDLGMGTLASESAKPEADEEKSLKEYFDENTDEETVMAFLKGSSDLADKFDMEITEDSLIFNIYLPEGFDLGEESKEKLDGALIQAISLYLGVANDLATASGRARVDITLNYYDYEGNLFTDMTYSNLLTGFKAAE